MKKSILIVLLLFFFNSLFSQNKDDEIITRQNSKVKSMTHYAYNNEKLAISYYDTLGNIIKYEKLGFKESYIINYYYNDYHRLVKVEYSDIYTPFCRMITRKIKKEKYKLNELGQVLKKTLIFKNDILLIPNTQIGIVWRKKITYYYHYDQSGQLLKRTQKIGTKKYVDYFEYEYFSN